MTVAAAFTELSQEFRQLEQAVGNVTWAIIQVRPNSAIGQSVADHYEAAVIDFSHLIQVARLAADNGQRASTDRTDSMALRAALVTCHDCTNQLIKQYYVDMASCERIEDLNDLAKRGGRDWAKWVLGVRDSLSVCPQVLHSISQALFRCWQEITEPIGPMSIST